MKLFLMSILRCCTAFIVAVYLALQGISFFYGLKHGIFHFDLLGDLIYSFKKGIFFGIIYGAGDLAMRKVKKIDEDKNKDK